MNESQSHPLLASRVYLYLTEFFSGMALMAVEIGAQRLISPYFSSSVIVWTIIIGTIMIAMALGNVYGGKAADRDPNPDALYRRILVAALWLSLIPFLGKYVIIAISAFLIVAVDSHFLTIAAFATCLIVFVFPLFLLGTVTPSLAKYTTRNLLESGRIVGNLGAANTIGSIIGTFLPTFVTIPSVGTSLTFLIFSGILLALALLYFYKEGAAKHKVKLVVSLIIFALACFFGHNASFVFWEGKDAALYEGESTYNYLRVKQEGNRTILSTNVLFGVQSVYERGGGLTGMYYDYALAAPFMAGMENGGKVLILGMGSGTYAHQLKQYLPGVNVSGVEIDGKITELARKYFDLPQDVKVTTYDGRAYLDKDRGTYNVIMVDAYQDITVPFQMSSVEFFHAVKQHLAPGGIMVLNMNMRGEEKGSINEYMADTVAHVFPAVYTVDVPRNTNRELFASADGGALTRFDTTRRSIGNRDLSRMMDTVAAGLTPYQGGSYLLTDDKAPVELLGMRTLDSIIRGEVVYYRDILKRDGWKGVLEEG